MAVPCSFGREAGPAPPPPPRAPLSALPWAEPPAESLGREKAVPEAGSLRGDCPSSFVCRPL